MTRRLVFAGWAVVFAAAFGLMVFAIGSRAAKPVKAGFVVPELSGTAGEGAALFTQFCIECHGENATGTDKGPPLIHIYYEPNHHPDQAFMVAALYGARQHHWQFGNMKPVEGITEAEVIKIISYVRAVQRANGIQ